MGLYDPVCSLRVKDKSDINLENKTGIYKLTCNNCDEIYIGQTGRPFKERFSEHLPTKN